MTIFAIIVCVLLLTRYIFVLTKYVKTGVYKKKSGGKHLPLKVAGYSFMMFALMLFIIFLALNTEIYGKTGDPAKGPLIVLFAAAMILEFVSLFLYMLYYMNGRNAEEAPVSYQKQMQATKANYTNSAEFIEIARIMSDGDNTVSLPADCTCDDLVSYLEENGYACECDYKAELDDFIYAIGRMKYGVKINKDSLDEKGVMEEWIKLLDLELQPTNLRVGYLDNDSDSYVVFFCSKDKARLLTKASGRIRFLNNEIAKTYKMEFPFRGSLGEDTENYVSGKDVYSHLSPEDADGIKSSWVGSEMIQYIDNDGLKNKLIDMVLTLKGDGVCRLIIGASEDLTEEDKARLKDYITGQVADGWGEGDYDFTYSKEDGSNTPCTISFWWNDSSWYIKYL